MAPPSNDGVHPSHHRTYGSRIRRFAIHLFNRSLHQSKLFCTFSKGYRFSWESVTQLAKINAPIVISRRTAFGPSPLVRPIQFSATRVMWVLWPLLTSLLYQPVVIETSPGNCIFFHPISAVSTYMHFWCSLGVTMMCLLTRAIMPRIRFLFVRTEFCSPASFSPNLTVSNLAAY